MLEKVVVENYKSIKNKTIIDFIAGKYTTLEEKNVSNGLLKGLFFLGANSSGKSNLLNSVSILLDLLFSEKIDISFQVCVFTNDNLKLEYTFNENGDKIVYYIEICRDGEIRKEILTLNTETMLNRIGTNAESYLTENRYYDKMSVDSKTLFLKNIYFNTKFTRFPSLASWFKFLRNSVYINFKRNVYITFSPNMKIDFMENGNDEDVILVNNFLKETGICEEIAYTNSMKIGLNMVINTGNDKSYYLKKDNCDYWMPLFLESEGNKDLMRLIPAILHIIHNNGMLIMDEFNSSFHNKLEELIINYIMEFSDKSQIVVATHSTNILKNSLIRPDQVYAVNFKGNEGTFISKFSNEQPRTSQNLEKMYLSGIFSGLPKYE